MLVECCLAGLNVLPFNEDIRQKLIQTPDAMGLECSTAHSRLIQQEFDNCGWQFAALSSY